MFGEEMADFCRSPVFIIGLGFDHEGGASWGISLVGDLLDGSAPFEFSGAFLDGPVDFVDGHGFGPGGGDSGAKPGVEIRVTPEEVGGDGDLFGELGEEGSAFDVGGTFGALDFGPMTMTCHIGERLRWKRWGKSAGKHALARGLGAQPKCGMIGIDGDGAGRIEGRGPHGAYRHGG